MNKPKKKQTKTATGLKRYGKTEALKLIREISQVDTDVIIQPHTLAEAKNDILTTRDILNTLRSTAARITEEPERGTQGDWKYRVKTNNICVVVIIKEIPTKKYLLLLFLK